MPQKITRPINKPISKSVNKLSNSTSLDLIPATWPVPTYSGVQAFTTHRQLASKLAAKNSTFDSFNLGLHVGDDKQSVLDNRALLAESLPKNTKIQWLEQVHGHEVVLVDSVQSQPIVTDAAVTTQPNVALAVMTADCLPILLSEPTGKVVAAIHGGWRPLAQNIIAKTIDAMPVSSKELVAWLGPCIGPKYFEVGAEVKSEFLKLSCQCEQAFTPSANDDKYLADLQQLAEILLKQSGVTHISKLAECTYSMPERYYSYRREQVTGRMASVIYLT